MTILKSSFVILLIILSLSEMCASWRYETRCTRITDPSQSSVRSSGGQQQQSEILDDLAVDNSPADNYEDDQHSIDSSSSSLNSHLTLRCANTNDFLFIGLTQYGVLSTPSNSTSTAECTQAVLLSTRTTLQQQQQNDCLVTVDYLANECNGLNSCRIQLDAQFLHSCKRHSDYLTLAYECIPGAQRVDVCSNDETFLIDSTLNTRASLPSSASPTPSASSSSSLSRFGAFYLTSPGYPNEYANNLANCSCRLEYVRIENSPSLFPSVANSDNLDDKTGSNDAEINLALTAYEFDLEEEADDTLSGTNINNNKCNKDYFRIDAIDQTSNRNETLCGHYKEFREFYSHGRSIVLNFKSDDFITRRGFLFKVSTIPSNAAGTLKDSCPTQAHRRFDSSRCVSVHHERTASWSEASRACVARGGRLLALNDFVDSMRMNAVVRGDEMSASSAAQFWVGTSNSQAGRKTNAKKKCASKSINGWHEEKSCGTKRPYICEYETIRRRASSKSSRASLGGIGGGMSDTNGNRLIRVSCGQPLDAATSGIFSTVTTTTTTDSPKSTTPSTKSIPSNSILNTQRPQRVDMESSSRMMPPAAIILDDSIVSSSNDKDEYDVEYESASNSATRSMPIQKSSSSSSTNVQVQSSRFGLSSLTQSDYLIIIAIVCGIAIVLVAVNVFCIWNYYNKKLNGHLMKHDFVMIDDDGNRHHLNHPGHMHHAFHHSSTLLSRSASTRPSQKKKNNNKNRSDTSKTSSSVSSNSSNSGGVIAGGVVGGLHANRTLTSCLGGSGGSYIRVPVYDLSGNNSSLPAARESTDSGISSSSFKQIVPSECLRLLLNGSEQMTAVRPTTDHQDPQTLSHYYETLSKKQQQQHTTMMMNNVNEYHVYNPVDASSMMMAIGGSGAEKFDSMVVVPVMGPNHQQAQSTVVLLTTANGQPVGFSTLTAAAAAAKATSQYSSMIYGDLGTSYGGSSTASSTASAASNKPLLASFAGHNNANNNNCNTTPSSNNSNNNASSVSTEIEPIESSSSSTSHSPIQDDPNV